MCWFVHMRMTSWPAWDSGQPGMQDLSCWVGAGPLPDAEQRLTVLAVPFFSDNFDRTELQASRGLRRNNSTVAVCLFPAGVLLQVQNQRKRERERRRRRFSRARASGSRQHLGHGRARAQEAARASWGTATRGPRRWT